MKTIYSLWLYSKALLFIIIFFPILLIVALVYPSAMYSYACFLSKGIFWCFNIKRHIIGNFPDTGKFILMHNHASFLDLFLLPTIIKGKYTGLVAKKNFSIPLIGSILKRIKAIPISRSNLKSAKESIQEAEKYIKAGFHIAIFPEGTRTTTGNLSPFKKGGFHMAVNTKSKILPIVVQGLYNIKPKTRWAIQPGVVTITIMEPIESIDKNVDDLLKEVESIYSNYDLA